MQQHGDMRNITALVIGLTLLLILPPFIAAWITFCRVEGRTYAGRRNRETTSILPLKHRKILIQDGGRNSRIIEGPSSGAQASKRLSTIDSVEPQAYCNALPTSPICSTSTHSGLLSQTCRLDPRNHWRTSHPHQRHDLTLEIEPYKFQVERADQNSDLYCQHKSDDLRDHAAKGYICPSMSSTEGAEITRTKIDHSFQYLNQSPRNIEELAVFIDKEIKHSMTHLSPILESPTSYIYPVSRHSASTLDWNSSQEMYEEDSIDRPDSFILRPNILSLPQKPKPALIPMAQQVNQINQGSKLSTIPPDYLLGTARTARISRNDVKIFDVRKGRYSSSLLAMDLSEETAKSAHRSLVAEWSQLR